MFFLSFSSPLSDRQYDIYMSLCFFVELQVITLRAAKVIDEHVGLARHASINSTLFFGNIVAVIATLSLSSQRLGRVSRYVVLCTGIGYMRTASIGSHWPLTSIQVDWEELTGRLENTGFNGQPGSYRLKSFWKNRD